MFHLLLGTGSRRTANSWGMLSLMSNYQVSHHVSDRRNSWQALTDISADYTEGPEAEVNYCLTKCTPRELSAVLSLTWICDKARECTLLIHSSHSCWCQWTDRCLVWLWAGMLAMFCLWSTHRSIFFPPHLNIPHRDCFGGEICYPSLHLANKLNFHATETPQKVIYFLFVQKLHKCFLLYNEEK